MSSAGACGEGAGTAVPSLLCPSGERARPPGLSGVSAKHRCPPHWSLSPPADCTVLLAYSASSLGLNLQDHQAHPALRDLRVTKVSAGSGSGNKAGSQSLKRGQGVLAGAPAVGGRRG